ncbi:MAG TPA: cobyrinate a,c-diamide synthase [Stellaceae bacterium]|nr:cobyrinate a,c-diamide synthase [Stellaceae bacterium]
MRGLIVSAPASAAGKTTVTLGLLRALTRRGIAVAPAKIGPDYIDPAFHVAATGRTSVNLDTWGMRPSTVAGLIAGLGEAADLVVVEGAMGLFDGASGPADPLADGSTAALAAATGWPVLLVVDCTGQAQSMGALVRGFAAHRPDVRIGGVVLNRIASERHRRMVSEAVEAVGVKVLATLPRQTDTIPSRHLGLVQAEELTELSGLIDRLADQIEAGGSIDAIMGVATVHGFADAVTTEPAVPPIGQRIAVARDAAFGFAYPHLLDGWRRAGAELVFFSPLSGAGPGSDCDAIYLPGGYPELHAGALAGNQAFLDGLRRGAMRGPVWGECGGYMVLGTGMETADGARFAMAGLLGLETSFAKRRLQFGYRQALLTEAGPLGEAGARFRGHEFHYSTIIEESREPPLFELSDAAGAPLPGAGRRRGAVFGSYLHLIDRA